MATRSPDTKGLRRSALPQSGQTITPPSPCNNIELRRATRHIGRLFDDVVGPCGLRAAQLGLLFYVEAAGAPTMKTMAKAIVMDLSALGQTLKPLIRDGYVALVADDKDGRVKRVHLTDKGREKYRDGMELWRLAQERFEAVLGAVRAREMREALALIASDEFGEAFRNAKPRPVARPAG